LRPDGLDRCWKSPQGVMIDWRKTETGWEPVYETRDCPLRLYSSPLVRFLFREYAYAVKPMSENAFEPWVREMPLWYAEGLRILGGCFAERSKALEAERKKANMARQGAIRG